MTTMSIGVVASVTLLLFLSTTSMNMTMSGANALSQSIVVIGLNPALQKRFVLPIDTDLEPGNVHRCARLDIGVGGKGQDVGVALSCLMQSSTKKREEEEKVGDEEETAPCDVSSRVILAQFLGAGAEGDAVSSALRYRHGLVAVSYTHLTLPTKA